MVQEQIGRARTTLAPSVIRSLVPAIVAAAGWMSPTAAQQPTPTPPCADTVVAGRAERGTPFVTPLNGDLALRLDPGPGSEGWTIRVTPAREANVDYAMVATPPYRFFNPRYLSTDYGVTAAEALAMAVRDFRFVAERAEYESALAALDVVLWPAGHSEVQVDEASAGLEGLRAYPGSLTISSGAVAPPTARDPLGVIEWVEFRARLCLPGAAAPRASP